jgi:tRNA A-37 threonylcarbamoyl transferase component Bud32
VCRYLTDLFCSHLSPSNNSGHLSRYISPFCFIAIYPLSKMAQASEENKTYVLDFKYDDADGCALTALVNDVRFHIIVDVKDLQKSREKPLYYEYLDKLYGWRDAERREEEEAEKQQLVGKGDSKYRSRDKDSAVDVSDDEDEDQDSVSASVELRDWVLAGFADVIAEWAPPNRDPIDSTLYEWYHGPTYFYSLQIKAGQLEPELLETSDDLNARIEKLVPRLKMPKYIQSINLPWLNANDLTVRSEVSLPEPAHPGLVVDKEGKEYFFKPCVTDQPGPIKREISILQKLGKLDVDIKVPQLLGFVSFDNSKTDILGFLLTPIASPKPLTTLLKSSIPRSQRADWATKSEKYVKTLHDNDIIWGDAKADNFMVDEHDELWIIDFGGSYTEGWVDPELSETVEGDDMGLEKVVKALENPDGETFDPEQTASSLFVTEKPAEDASSEIEKVEQSGKRKRGDDDDEHEVEESKRRKEDDSGHGSEDEFVPE